ncbi:hypothetical protein PV772_11520 [Pseudarthrobacter sp. CC12]|jgi:hypothetical protein|uniref:hypothetical protein n=1 Tax=unclassified Pseudarthrobacter TaxID=2647000 RepID=UPI0010E72FC2|nr:MULTISPECIES: hypothetical protein [unclassified Pseudarthrobacter]
MSGERVLWEFRNEESIAQTDAVVAEQFSRLRNSIAQVRDSAARRVQGAVSRLYMS